MQYPPQSEINRRCRRLRKRADKANQSNKQLCASEAGQTLVEYALILTLLSVTIVGTMLLFDFAFPEMGGGLINAIASASS